MKQDFYCTHAAKNLYPKITAAFISRHPDSHFLKKIMYLKYKMKPGNKANIEKIKKTADAYGVGASYDRDELAADVLWSQRVHGVSLAEYFMFEFYYKNSVGKNEFLCDRERFFILRPLYTGNSTDVLECKYKSYEVFGEYYKRECILVSDENDFDKFDIYTSAHPIFVFKLTKMYCGISIKKIDINNYASKRECFNSLLSEGEFIAEELINQTSEMSEFNPSSVNTIRMPTYLLKSGEVVIDIPFLKVGRVGSFVDNGGAGGILVQIDLSSGVTKTLGVDEMGNEFAFHPDTGAQLVGVKIPRWNEAVELAEKLAKFYPDAKSIAWDFALTDNGWVVVEANPFGQFIAQQVTDKTGKKRETIKIVNACL